MNIHAGVHVVCERGLFTWGHLSNAFVVSRYFWLRPQWSR